MTDIQDSEKNNPLVTIAIPSYNHSSFVETAIRSVWKQTYRPIELIVVDDGSTDGSYKKIAEMQERSPISMSVFQQENKGLTATLNCILSHANGTYFGIVASDDMLITQHTQALVTALETTEIDNVAFAYADVEIMNSDGTQTGRRQLESRNPKSGDVFFDLVSRKYFPQGCANLYKTNALRIVGGFDERFIGEGWSLYLRLAAKFNAIYVDKPLSFYRVGSGSLNLQLEERLDEFETILNEALEQRPDISRKCERDIWSQFYTSIADSFYALGNFPKSFKYIIKSAKTYPNLKQFDLLIRISIKYSLYKIKNIYNYDS